VLFKKLTNVWVFENRVERQLFIYKKEGLTGEWRKLHHKGLYDLHSSLDIIRVIKTRKINWTGRVASLERRKTSRI